MRKLAKDNQKDNHMKQLIDVASGRVKADIVIKNANVADVFNGVFVRGDVAVCGDKIAGVGRYSGVTEIDGTDKYVMPSFYDAHMHFESVMIRPSEYLKAAVARGVTAFNADPHEIANVCGEAGIKFMIDDVKGIPADVRFMMPSCVPATPEDCSGCVLDARAVKDIADKYGLFGLGEMMNYPGVIGADADVMQKLGVRNIIDGHAPSLSGNALNAYLCGNILTDHECESVEEVLENPADDRRFLRNNGQCVPLPSVTVHPETPVGDSLRHPLAGAPLHIIADGSALLLGKGREDGQHQFAVRA